MYAPRLHVHVPVSPTNQRCKMNTLRVFSVFCFFFWVYSWMCHGGICHQDQANQAWPKPFANFRVAHNNRLLWSFHQASLRGAAWPEVSFLYLHLDSFLCLSVCICVWVWVILSVDSVASDSTTMWRKQDMPGRSMVSYRCRVIMFHPHSHRPALKNSTCSN